MSSSTYAPWGGQPYMQEPTDPALSPLVRVAMEKRHALNHAKVAHSNIAGQLERQRQAVDEAASRMAMAQQEVDALDAVLSDGDKAELVQAVLAEDEADKPIRDYLANAMATAKQNLVEARTSTSR